MAKCPCTRANERRPTPQDTRNSLDELWRENLPMLLVLAGLSPELGRQEDEARLSDVPSSDERTEPDVRPAGRTNAASR